MDFNVNLRCNSSNLLLAGIVDRVQIRHQMFVAAQQLGRGSMHAMVEWMEVCLMRWVRRR